MHVIFTCKYETDLMKNSQEKVATPFSPIITLWELSEAMATRVPIRSGSKPNTAFPPTPMMLQIKFGCDRPAGCGDIYI